MNYRCVIEYDGTDFCGWQFQPKERTVQGEFEKALKKMAKEVINVTAAGRTDSGVHASGQVINFRIDRDWSAEIVLKGLNSLLPRDVLIRNCAVANEKFNSRFDAKSRQYRYQIYNGRSALKQRLYWCTELAIDFDVLDMLAANLAGSHDFGSFCVLRSYKESNMCTLTKSFWTKRGKQYTFHVEANRFLHGMVRSLVGTMVKVANGQLSKRDFSELIRNPERSARILTAPPQGLCLVKVRY